MNLKFGIRNLKQYTDQDFEIWNTLQPKFWYMESGIQNLKDIADQYYKFYFGIINLESGILNNL